MVWVVDVPTKKTGLCWRCHVKFLTEENKNFREQLENVKKERDGGAFALFETIARLKIIVLYFDKPEVKKAVEAWLEWDEDGVDWLNPPAMVDEELEKLEHFKTSLRQFFPEFFPA